MENHGVSVDDVDTWTANIHMPEYSYLKPGWLKARVSQSDIGHLKAFASDCIAVIDCLSLFIEIVMRGTALETVLQKHLDCFFGSQEDHGFNPH